MPTYHFRTRLSPQSMDRQVPTAMAYYQRVLRRYASFHDVTAKDDYVYFRITVPNMENAVLICGSALRNHVDLMSAELVTVTGNPPTPAPMPEIGNRCLPAPDIANALRIAGFHVDRQLAVSIVPRSDGTYQVWINVLRCVFCNEPVSANQACLSDDGAFHGHCA